MLMINPVSALASTYGQYQSARASVARVAEIMNCELEDYGSDDAVSIGDSPEIEFRDVWFGYDAGKPIIKGLNLFVRSGETVLITGDNGVGKSTLMSLLCRFIKPDHGQILIDGVDIRNMQLPHLRRQIGLVHQESQLLNRTITENLEYGMTSEKHSVDQMIEEQGIEEQSIDEQAVSDSGGSTILDFIKDLKAGFDTEIVEKGANLSGGQRQRISLARILKQQQPIVILDEAMSMQDATAESRFMAEAQSLLNQQTVLIVSHNESLSRYADRLIRVESGVISDDQIISGNCD